MYTVIVFLPLIGFLAAGLWGRTLGAKGSEYVTSGFLIISAVLSWIAFFLFAFSESPPETVQVLRWVESGALKGRRGTNADADADADVGASGATITEPEPAVRSP